jgi:PAS domain S-box-containing protein
MPDLAPRAGRRGVYEELFDQARDPAFVIDPIDDRIVAANSAACDLLGYSSEELLATPVSRIHPAELPQLHAFVGRVLQDGAGTTLTLTCRTKSGDFLPAEMSLNAFSSGGRSLILALVQDRSGHRGRAPGD